MRSLLRAAARGSVLLLASWAALAGACSPRSVLSSREGVTEGDTDCDACVADLVACISTSRGDAQFMQCRDLFAGCQQKASLGPADCENPRGEDACAICDDRRSFCQSTELDPARCSEDHAQCVARLGDAASSCAAVYSEGSGGAGGCADCEPSSGGTGGAGGDSGGEGGAPESACHEPCELGGPMETSCGACAETICAADPYCCTTAWDKYCVKATLDVPACGCTTSLCSHSECSTGGALSSDCSNCATLVCATEPNCCLVEWTSACVAEAAAVAECACAGF